MRKCTSLDPLINKTTQGLLAATVLQPGRWWYLSDLANHLRRRPSSLQTPVAALVSAGILRRRKKGNRVYKTAVYFERCRRKRNELSYDMAGVVTDTEAAEILVQAKALQDTVQQWIGHHHPHLR